MEIHIKIVADKRETYQWLSIKEATAKKEYMVLGAYVQNGSKRLCLYYILSRAPYTDIWWGRYIIKFNDTGANTTKC